GRVLSMQSLLSLQRSLFVFYFFFFFQAEDGIRDGHVLEFRRVLFRSTRCGPAPWPGCAVGSGADAPGAGPVRSGAPRSSDRFRESAILERRRHVRRPARRLLLARSRGRDRKSTRLNSSHVSISYAVFCLKKKKK